jgi:hypothetical protein
MANRLGAVVERKAAESVCCHHWIIETPAGPTSKGVCKLCGAEKEFDNFPENVWLKDDVPAFLKPEDLIDIEDNMQEEVAFQ